MSNDNLVEVVCENNQSTMYVNEGTNLEDMLGMVGLQQYKPYLAAFVDNHSKELTYRIFSSKSIRFIPYNSSEGRRIYARSLFFMLLKTVKELFPNYGLRMLHPVGRGYYCEMIGAPTAPTPQQIEAIRERMRTLAQADMPLVRGKVKMEQAIEYFDKQGIHDKLLLLRTRPQFYVSMYNLGGLLGYFYGTMVSSTAALKVFDIEPYGDGFVMLLPWSEDPTKVEPICLQPRLYEVFRQNKEWAKILHISNVGSLNKHILDGQGSDVIKIGEALQEKNFAHMADVIFQNHHNQGVKLILIAGPSSSGKTTFSKRLAIQLRVLGLEPQMVSLDNYFVERGLTPRDENGEADYECIEALDVESFNADLNRLMEGQDVELCRFDFKDGKRYFDGQMSHMNANSVLIVEGIHALNPNLVPHIDPKVQFKIYASALTTLAVDNTTTIHTTDNRLLRRIVRDNSYRGRSAYETLKGWSSVRRGEDKYIFPYQEQADVMFNTALIFEFPILARHAMPLLELVPATEPESAEAIRLLRFLNYFVDMSEHQVPPTSILREFIGGSSFEY
ncbi:MAG: nucleoside kinase [Mucinivorans sp.]